MPLRTGSASRIWRLIHGLFAVAVCLSALWSAEIGRASAPDPVAERVVEIVGRSSEGFTTFQLTGLSPGSVVSARLVHGNVRTAVSRNTMRRAIGKGELRVRRSRLSRLGDRGPARASARRTKLVVTVAQDTNPLKGTNLYVDPESEARRQADAWRADRPADAAQMDKIAAQSQADWFGDWNMDVRTAVDARVSTVAAAGAMPVLVAYNIPLRDCSGYSAGGAGSPDAYRTWIRAFAAGIGSRRAVVVLEPDALAALDCLSSADRSTRVALLKEAVEVLADQAGISVYIDAGNSAWISAPVMAGRLSEVGIAKARGFALNVSNFRSTPESGTYGRSISDSIGSKPFVIDTSRNGLSPSPDRQWCNPDGRALGPVPTVAPASEPRVDALLWIKRPGQSDGTCNGGPAAGSWWPDYALGLAQRAQW